MIRISGTGLRYSIDPGPLHSIPNLKKENCFEMEINRIVNNDLECSVVNYAQTPMCAPPEGPFPSAQQDSETTSKKKLFQELSVGSPIFLRASQSLELP